MLPSPVIEQFNVVEDNRSDFLIVPALLADDNLKKPDVRVSWSELRKTSGSIFFTGEVRN